MNIIKQRLSEEEIDEKGIRNWPIWTCEISEFDWEYNERESCLILEGEIEVSTTKELVYCLKILLIKFDPIKPAPPVINNII